MVWYYRHSENQFGPVNDDAIKALCIAGRVLPSTPVWRDGMDDWMAACDSDLAPLFAQGRRPSTQSSLDDAHASIYGMEDGGDIGGGFRKIIEDIRALDYGFLLPLGKLLNPSLLRKRAVRWTLTFGLMPLAIWHLSDWLDLNCSEVLWLMELYFCLFWVIYFTGLIQTDKETVRRGAGYFIFTIIIGMPLLYAFQEMPIIRDFYAQTESYSLVERLSGFVFGVGVMEESCKALPLLVFGLRAMKIKSAREGVFLGMLSGFGFAAAEGVLYIGQAAVGAVSYGTDTAVSSQFSQFLFRMVTGPLLHAAWAGTVGWFIGTAAVRCGPKWPVVVVGILFTAVLHGVHDVLAGGVYILVTSALTFTTLFAYLTHGDNFDPISAKQ